MSRQEIEQRIRELLTDNEYEAIKIVRRGKHIAVGFSEHPIVANLRFNIEGPDVDVDEFIENFIEKLA